MAFKAFICEVSGDFVAPEACLACARNGALPGCQMTSPVIQGILTNMRPDDPEALVAAGYGALTVTTLLSCPRKWRLKIECDYAEKPSSLWWAFRGQLVHEMVAAVSQLDQQVIVERRFSMLVEAANLPADVNEIVPASEGMVEITGQPDQVYLDRALLVDYKTTKRVPQPWKTYTCPNSGEVLRQGQWRPRYGTVFECGCGKPHKSKEIETVSPPRAYAGHILQISTYAALLRENGISIEAAEVVYLDMEKILRVSIELMGHEEVLDLLRDRLPGFVQCDLPKPLAPIRGKQPWECRYCVVAKIKELYT
ncbi:MAG: hypothetical protein ISR58_08445 [Anaerolineales bacterium]|nr:hypothetical protein [Chloroflexota bacterium]MBL6981208.1 hypothetical protein [Anaerolineales bacterium]